MPYEKTICGIEDNRRQAKYAAARYLQGSGLKGSQASWPAFVAFKSGASDDSDKRPWATPPADATSNPFSFRNAPEQIHDLGENLLFLDYVEELDKELELRVRTGANKALGSLIVSVAVSKPLNRPRLIAAALAKAQELNLGQPVARGKVICYAYPRLGMLFLTSTGKRVVMDLFNYEVQPVPTEATFKRSLQPSRRRGLWLPLHDLAEKDAEIAAGRFDAEADELAGNPESAAQPAQAESLGDAPAAGDEHKIDIHLFVQVSDNFCAPAASEMILDRYGISLTQDKIAAKMGDIDTIRLEGTRPTQQVSGLNDICGGIGLKARLIHAVGEDWNQMLPNIKNELASDRPIQRQLKVPAHVDVIAGWRKSVGSDDLMLWIFDPRKPDGDERLDRWSMVATNINDLIFLGPPGQ